MSGWWVVSYVVLWVVMMLTILVLLVVLRQLGLIYLRARSGSGLQLEEGPPIGTPIRFDELDITGQAVHFPDRRSMLNVVIFTTPSCSLCKDTLRGLAAALSHYDVNAVVIDAGNLDDSRAARGMVSDSVGFISSLSLQRRLRVTLIPFGIVTSDQGCILTKGGVNHIDDLEDLLEEAEKEISPTFAQ